MSNDILTIEVNKGNRVESKEKFENNQLNEKGNEENSNFALEKEITSRLMNTKIVRIRPGTICACNKGFKKLIFNINTISKRDDQDPNNENETPLLYAEEFIFCSCLCFGSCSPEHTAFHLYAPNTKKLYSMCNLTDVWEKIEECCEEPYYKLPSIHNMKPSNGKDESLIKRYDTRSVYRTYDYLGQSHYKIGKPYVKEKEPGCCEAFLYTLSSLPCCFCFKICICNHKEKLLNLNGCCCCCRDEFGVIDDKRTYIDIFNMNDESVGKFALYFRKGILCQNDELFYEIYFPPDANDMIRLALISQILFFHKSGGGYFGTLPGSRDNLEQFIN